MDYNRNIDKVCERGVESSLYNNVLSVPLSDGAEPVTLTEAKLWGKIDQDDDDAIVTALITAARRVCEKYSGIGFLSRSITATIDNANGGFNLPYGPVTSTPTATSMDGATTLDIVWQGGQLVSPYGKMIVAYTGGYASLPEDLKTALKCQFLFMYENRGESATGLSPMAQMILEPLREVV